MNDFGTEFEQKGVIGGEILYIAMHALCNKKQSITFTGHLKYALHMPCPWEQIHGLNLFQRIPLFTQELSIAAAGEGLQLTMTRVRGATWTMAVRWRYRAFARRVHHDHIGVGTLAGQGGSRLRRRPCSKNRLPPGAGQDAQQRFWHLPLPAAQPQRRPRRRQCGFIERPMVPYRSKGPAKSHPAAAGQTLSPWRTAARQRGC